MRNKLLVCIVLLLITSLILGGCGGTTDGENEDGLETRKIVALLPLTGVLGTFGENSAEVSKLATDDVNAWLEQEGKDWRLDLTIDDTQTEGEVALRKMQTWYGDGVHFFVGPQASGEVGEVLAFANSNEILFVSQSATSPALEIADDWFYRFCTSDTIQGPAIGTMAKTAGVKNLIFTWRGDGWGDGLQETAEESAIGHGIEISNKLRYDEQLEEFSVQAATLDGYVSDLVDSGVSLDDIGIVVIAFEEIEPYMTAANEYPQLKEINWIGSDGTALSESLASSTIALQFAADAKFINSMNRPESFDDDSNFEYVRQHVLDTLGRETDAYSYNIYDMIWSLAMSIDEVGYDTVKVRDIFPRVTDEWTKENGASGHVVLNEFGDRAFADYDMWMINEDLKWENVGWFDSRAGSINWARDIY